MDLRVSAKDLIGNHLTMALYNHAAVWKHRPEMWPRGYYCNGHVLLDGEKMSKSSGNFLMMHEARCESRATRAAVVAAAAAAARCHRLAATAARRAPPCLGAPPAAPPCGSGS